MTQPSSATEWAGLDAPLARHLHTEGSRCLEAYRANPKLILEHANIERDVSQGGYGRRQIYELVQNGADALLGFPDGRIEVVLTHAALYCANQGVPIDEDGADTILAAHVSAKRAGEIGRFGLGFKSVLGVCEAPEFYSRSGSFRFSRSHSEEAIRAIKPDAARVPILRLAEPVDPAARPADAILDNLMEWATTIVKLPLSRGHDWLRQDLRAFPPEFLLFSPHVGELLLHDRSEVDDNWSLSEERVWRRRIALRARRPASKSRNQAAAARGFSVTLEEDGETAEWKVFRRMHRPSQRAKLDGGELAEREELPIMWAVPVRERTARSRFWAFFPTEEFITLSGVLNAPWKTNSDRQNVLQSRFNEELLEAAAELVVESLPALIDDSDPTRYLEMLPALNDNPCWGDIHLAGTVYRLLSETACVLDQDGVLRRPQEVKLHPRGIAREALALWSSFPKRPADWAHSTIVQQHRRARVERLKALASKIINSPFTEPSPELVAAPFAAWLEVLVADKSTAASAHALRVAAVAVEANGRLRNEAEIARIIKTASDEWVAPRPGLVFLPPDDFDPRDAKTTPLALTHPNLLEQDEVKQALEVLGIRRVEATSQLEAMLEVLATMPAPRLKAYNWTAFWQTVGGITTQTSLDMIKAKVGAHAGERLWVRTRAGAFAPLCRVLWPGEVLPGDDLQELEIVADAAFHVHDTSILREFGLFDSPRPDGASPRIGMADFFEEYREACIERYLDGLITRSKPQTTYLNFRASSGGEPTTTGPLDIYAALTRDESKARFCAAILKHALLEEPWLLRHDTQRDKYPPRKFEPPSLWLVKTYGFLSTSRGPRAMDESFAPALARWSAVLPVANCEATVADALGLVTTLDDLGKNRLLRLAPLVEEARDSRLLAEYYAAAVRADLKFDRLRCRVGDKWEMIEPQKIFVESRADHVGVLVEMRVAHLQAFDKDATTLIEHYGVQRTTFDTRVIAAPADEATPLLDRFPGLWSCVEKNAFLQGIEIVPCSSLSRATVTKGGTLVHEQNVLREGNTLYYLETLSREEVLRCALDALELPLDETQRAELLDHQSKLGGKERVLAVRRASGLPAKLLAAVGEKSLRRRLPRGLLLIEEELRGKPSALRLAEMALAVFGVSVLQELREELAQSGLEPPQQWAGRHAARKWVALLGFPAEYAGFEGASRAPVVEVEGPPELPPPHAYQEAMMTAIRLLASREAGRRGLLSLPTGAGKTRVTVEALVHAIKEDGLTRGTTTLDVCTIGVARQPILWIAQSDELCEQAVMTWRHVWRAIGPQERLVISRLWGANESDVAREATQVVVATIDKLQRCLSEEGYDWLRNAAFVVVDEAHGAVTTEYTYALNRLGLTWHGQERGDDRCPLLGLTATAFRGNEEETRRLVNRFGGYRLDYEEWGDDPYPYLQNLGVLACVDHKEIAGRSFTLNAQELQELQKFHRLPSSVEERIGMSKERNRLLLEEIKSLDADWPVLLFATSVAHAQIMAALLQLEGISAAAISGQTPAPARRFYIEEFRRNRIRVLTNFNVLTTGFDAPSVRCVLVARPTYSPGLYQQMIGRGLRGPKNGGKERCLIINVRDNIAQYGHDLAFRQFEYLWNPAARPPCTTSEVVPENLISESATGASANGSPMRAFHSDRLATQSTLLRGNDDLFARPTNDDSDEVTS